MNTLRTRLSSFWFAVATCAVALVCALAAVAAASAAPQQAYAATTTGAAGCEIFQPADSSALQGFYARVCNGLVDLETDIDVSEFGISPSQISYTSSAGVTSTGATGLAAAVRTHPLFSTLCVSWSGFSFETSGNAIAKVKVTYLSTWTSTLMSAFKSGYADFLSGAPVSGTDFQKAAYVHDWVCARASYSMQTANLPDFALGCIANGKALCAGYSYAYQFLAQQLGLQCNYVSGTTKVEAHAWNKVKIDGQWFLVDTTWDRALASATTFSHTYFMLNDTEFAAAGDGSHDSDTDVTGNDPVNTGYYFANKFWQGVSGPLSAAQLAQDPQLTAVGDAGSGSGSGGGSGGDSGSGSGGDSGTSGGDSGSGSGASGGNTGGSTGGNSGGGNSGSSTGGNTGTTATQPVANGIYYIRTTLSSSKCLDVSGGSTSNSARIQAYSNNQTEAQKFKFAYNKKTGTYTITNLKSGKVLDAAAGVAKNGTAVQQYESNGTAAQRWYITSNSDGSITICSAINKKMVVDLTGGSSSNGTKAQLYAANGTKAQKFKLVSAVHARTIADGTYTLTSTLKAGKVLDIAGGSKGNAARAQLYAANGTNAQKFKFKYDAATGYYTITNVGSNKVLDAAAGVSDNGTTVQQYVSNNTAAQHWIITKNSNGSFTLRSAINPNQVVDVAGASTANETKVQLYESNGTKAQCWKIA